MNITVSITEIEKQDSFVEVSSKGENIQNSYALSQKEVEICGGQE